MPGYCFTSVKVGTNPNSARQTATLGKVGNFAGTVVRKEPTAACEMGEIPERF